MLRHSFTPLLHLLQVVYEIPAPGPTARLEMLKYHGRNKPVEDEGLYYKVAEVTAGWSAAALANLMNEAAILTVSWDSGCTCWLGGMWSGNAATCLRASKLDGRDLVDCFCSRGSKTFYFDVW